MTAITSKRHRSGSISVRFHPIRSTMSQPEQTERPGALRRNLLRVASCLVVLVLIAARYQG